MKRAALWINRRLLVQIDGAPAIPGAGPAKRWRERDGTELAIIARGDAFDVYFAKKTAYNFAISPRTALSLAVFLLRWWIFSNWLGLRGALWRWSLRQLFR